MKTRTLALALVALFAAIMVAFAADDVNMGTWKLNEAKSKIPAGAGKNTDVVYAMAGDSVKVTVDGVDGAGKPTHNEWTGKFDGKDYPVTGDPEYDMRAYTRVNDHTLSIAEKKGGEVTLKGRIVVAPDGKSRTLTTHTTDAKGNKVTTVTVYDKQ
jgi:hypothetical protein